MVFGVKVRFCGGTHQTAEKPGVFPLSCCEAIPPIPHPTVQRGNHRSLTVVRLIRKEEPTCWRFLRFAACDFQAAKPRVWQVRRNSALNVR